MLSIDVCYRLIFAINQFLLLIDFCYCPIFWLSINFCHQSIFAFDRFLVFVIDGFLLLTSFIFTIDYPWHNIELNLRKLIVREQPLALAVSLFCQQSPDSSLQPRLLSCGCEKCGVGTRPRGQHQRIEEEKLQKMEV